MESESIPNSVNVEIVIARNIALKLISNTFGRSQLSTSFNSVMKYNNLLFFSFLFSLGQLYFGMFHSLAFTGQFMNRLKPTTMLQCPRSGSASLVALYPAA